MITNNRGGKSATVNTFIKNLNSVKATQLKVEKTFTNLKTEFLFPVCKVLNNLACYNFNVVKLKLV